MVAPVAAVRPYWVPSPNGSRTDEYYWMRDDNRQDPEVLAYLAAENRYRDAVLGPVQELEDALFEQLVARIKKDDVGVPYRDRGYHYYRRFVTGGEYPVYARKRGSLDAKEQVLLDGNELAKGHGFFALGSREVSPNGQRLAYFDDTVGRRQYTLRFKQLNTGKLLPDFIENLGSQVAWAGNNTVFYIAKDPTTLLGNKVMRHVLGQPVAKDVVVYEEKDPSFYLAVGITGDHQFVTIEASSTVSGELRYLATSDPLGAFQVLAPRERDHEYTADHIAGRWVIRSNWQARDFRLMMCSDKRATAGRSSWQALAESEPQVHISGFQLFEKFLVIEERRGGLSGIRIVNWKTKQEFFAPTDEAVYATSVAVNAEQKTVWLRYRYTSLKTPSTLFELNMETGERRTLKQQEVLGGFDSKHYRTTRQWAEARDGTRIPVSLVSRVDTPQDGTAPLYQYGYGSYGISLEPSFRHNILSLLDRGFVYAVAHIRGGQEMGRQWYEDGKLLNKKNTFTDFIDVTEFLIANKIADPTKVVAAGGSAGGLLIGAVANMRPELYGVMVAHVPFVDVVTTMLDESIPLTTNEFDEWGNPKEKIYYDYMLSYSPYDNIKVQNYPALMVMTGLWDSQVQYYEPTKWVARLRARNTSRTPIVYSVNLEAGHGGASGRFRRYRDTAREYAFILQQLGMAPPL